MSECKTCGCDIHRRNKSGLCKRCIFTDPDMIAKKREATRKFYRENPEALAAKTRQLVAQTKTPEHSARARKMVLENRLWERGHEHYLAGSEAAIRGGQRVSAVRLAWCPPELRDDYRFLLNSKNVPAAEARAMIEDQHEMQMARWRRSVGIEVPVVPEVTFEAPADLPPLQTALNLAASHFRVTVEDILSKSREHKFVKPRYAVTLAMHRLGFSYSAISVALSRGDHTSAMNWRERGAQFAKADRRFAKTVDELVACWPALEVAA